MKGRRPSTDEARTALATLAAYLDGLLADAAEAQARVRKDASRAAYSIPEAARLVGVSRTLMASLVSDGRVRSIQLGRRRVIPADALDGLLNGELTE